MGCGEWTHTTTDQISPLVAGASSCESSSASSERMALGRRLRELPARAFAWLAVVLALVVFVSVFVVAYDGLRWSSNTAMSIAGLAASGCLSALVRFRKTVPEDPVWLQFWAPIATAIAVTTSACKLLAQSQSVPRLVSDAAVLGFYVLPIAVATWLGRQRLASLPLTRRHAVETRYRRRVFGVRREFVRRALLGVGVVVGCYALFVIVVLATGSLNHR